MTSYNIPFNRASFQGNERKYMAQAVSRGHIAGDGGFTACCSQWLEKRLKVPRALLTTSCTHALEMAALLMRIEPGDEVIMPSFTFVSTANAFVLRGARPVFIDIRPDTLNMDEARLEECITERTKAIIPVHYAGVSCDMDAIMDIARRYEVRVVEDNAHGLFGRYKGKDLGTFGCLATQSFHETKNITCGEGGALLINDAVYVERAEIIREKGTNRSKFFRGEVDKYTWVDLGSSYLPSDLLAGFLFAQLEVADRVQSKRRRVWETYEELLRGWTTDHGIRLPAVPEYCEQAFHMFYLILPSFRVRQLLIDHLKARGILSVFHYLPLHKTEVAQRFGVMGAACPVTEDMSDRLLRLPFYNDLTESDQHRVVNSIRDFFGESLVD